MSDDAAPCPELAVVLASWNRRDDLARLLDALDRQTLRPRTEVVVVDNGSGDGTAAMIAARPTPAGAPPTRLLALPRNVGPAIARNLGLLVVRAPYTCFIDTDAYPVEPDLLERQVARLRADGPAATCGASTIIYEDAACEKVWLTAGYFLPTGHYDPWRARSHTEDAMWLSTCFATYPTALLRELGGFDTHYVYGYEDADLGMRARRRSGGALWIDTGRRVVHLMSDAGRTRDWRHFHTMFCYFEYHRHYWVMANVGFGEMLRRIAAGPWRRRDLWRAYLMRLTWWQWFLALAWYPAVNLAAAPWWAVAQRRDHLAAALRLGRRAGWLREEELAPAYRAAGAGAGASSPGAAAGPQSEWKNVPRGRSVRS